ncbi:hypothetical protein K2173_014002 [Erythroxylum novogranatense]|uniref:Kinesin motor domain-containing protein n=1 Tax=Erythroxylum novogranatense TaxID=1862640 RepID=A0AAV8SD14_9ROSI|nr:hypothetical protein K2173_014002 [Erythroxylum novogranatense]
MPFISEAASAIKSRFGFHDRSSSETGTATQRSPDLLKSVNREAQSLVMTSAIRSIGEWADGEVSVARSVPPLPPPSHAQSFELCEDPSFWNDHNVQVIIRVRPLSSTEISQQGYNKCVRQESCQTITWTGHPDSRFTFDLVADESVSQEKLFKVAGVPMVENCVGGYNSCMFAYGQTGSGKTHTMLGDIESGTRRHSVNCGMTPRVFEYLFSRIQKEKEARKDENLKFTCKCSFLEIYNEQILDLLDPSSNNLQIREDVKKGIYVENLKEVEVSSARDVIQQLLQGAANRKVAATNMNHASSRSHSVFTCIIESKWESQGITHHRFARLNLVDLAGSERQKSSGAEGERLKEATNINKSLSTLGLVIMNLVSMSNGKTLHVPYRDSKLTFLLQDSLGGNSKTIIIANVSPSLCCSLETLSTLKFAQRAKFIKNNAIVNEDTSGDVIAMRMQIQQLKKEVSRLRGLVNGSAENFENDNSVISFPGSPGIFKWESESFSPLLSEKTSSQKKDYEAVLVAAFRREKDKDSALKASTEEIQAALRLAKQREDEIQGLKMRLRFREAGIKRLEAVASGKIAAETHLLKEKEEHLKEIEVLRAQVDRNQEVTRFAMENLRLKEEIRRLKSFYEEGEREMMSEQITMLQNKLLEALDWKLMHESESLAAQKTNIVVVPEAQDVQPISSQELRLPWHSAVNEENEFLRVQAIQNQAEIDTLRKQLDVCMAEKEELERYVNDLVTKLEEERSLLRATREERHQVELPPLSSECSIINSDNQMELKTMVDAIAAASQREAEAHEEAIILSKENDELQLKLKASNEANDELQKKLKALIEEKNSLIEMYERAASENSYKNLVEAGRAEQDDQVKNKTGGNAEPVKETETSTVVKNLEYQLLEVHEENEKLMNLYEKAMHERDEFKRMVSSSGQNRVEFRDIDCPEKLVEVDAAECVDSFGPPINDGTKSLMEDDSHMTAEFGEEDAKTLQGADRRGTFPNVGSSDLNLVREKLETAKKKLSDTTKYVPMFSSFEKAFLDFGNLSREIKAVENELQVKQQELASVELLSSQAQERKGLVDKKLSALRYSLSNFSSSVPYFEQREVRARGRVTASLFYLEQKKHELAGLQSCQDDLEIELGRIQETEYDLRNNLANLKSKLEEEKRRQESEKVLFAIDNIERVDTSQRYVGGKATELLKSEEEKSKLQTEIRLSHEKLSHIRRKFEEKNKKFLKTKTEIQAVELEIQKGSRSVEEMEHALKGVVQEKESILEIREDGMSEILDLFLEYHQLVFEADAKEAEMKILEEELLPELKRVEELRTIRMATVEMMIRSLEDTISPSEKMEEELQIIQTSVLEAKMLLEERC